MRNILLFLLFVLLAGALSAQDIHYSQFYNSPLNVNPGKTGIFNGDKRVNLSYRSQWSSVPVPWTTFSGSFDRKWYPKNGQEHFFSGGILLNHDREGSGASIAQSNINLTGSWTKIMNEQNLFTIGILLGYANRNFDPSSLTWDNQWNGTQFIQSNPTGEPTNAQSTGFLDNGIGLNYRWQKSKRTKLDLGLGVFHLIEPNTSILEPGPGGSDNINLPRRISLTGVGTFQVAQKLDIQLDALAQFQGEYSEFVIGALGKIHVNQRRGKETELHLGVGYRTSGSLFPVIALQHKNFYVSANYDVNIKDFSQVAGGNPLAPGHRPTSFELHFNYIISDVRPLGKAKVCPIF